MYRVVVGIELLELGYKKIKLQPQPDSSMQFANASFESNYGKKISGWQRKDGNIVVPGTVPANTTAEIILQDNGYYYKSQAAWVLKNRI